jgi:hypothetical protein
MMRPEDALPEEELSFLSLISKSLASTESVSPSSLYWAAGPILTGSPITILMACSFYRAIGWIGRSL